MLKRTSLKRKKPLNRSSAKSTSGSVKRSKGKKKAVSSKRKKHTKITLGKQNRERNLKHRKFVASLGCVITENPEAQCAHLSKGRYSGSLKAGDDNCVGLHPNIHAWQTRYPGGEVAWWEMSSGFDSAKSLAKQLFKHTGQREKCEQIILEWRKTWA